VICEAERLESVGAVTSGIVTVVDCGDPFNIVCVCPVLSAIANELALTREETTGIAFPVAVEVAVIVHMLDVV
jgi:mannose/fructose/N-acetylgalactosamine-specific phosphotransferase system component IID